jgi:hypothetical protein
MGLRYLQRRRAFARMVATVCVGCRKRYGPDILRMAKETGYFWNPAPGHSVIRLRVPTSTFLVTCPHCYTEAEFTPTGTMFQQPKEGVRSFTRRIVRT